MLDAMADKSDPTTGGSRIPGSRRPGRVYNLSKNALVTVSGGFAPFYEGAIETPELRRIAMFGDVADHQLQSLKEWLECVLVCVAMENDDRDEEFGGHFTRRQLLDSLSKLTRFVEGAPPPVIPAWLVNEIEFTERSRLLDAELGPNRRRVRSSVELLKIGEALRRATHLASQRFQASLGDARKLGEMACDAHAYVSARQETTQEHFAARRALNLNKSQIAVSTLDFWTGQLGRPDAITDKLIALTGAVYSLCGFKPMKPDAIKAQLYNARDGRPNLSI